MNEYKLKEGKMSKGAVKAYKAVENSVVDAYQKVEDSFVNGYKRIEDAFVDVFLEKKESDDSPENNEKAE